MDVVVVGGGPVGTRTASMVAKDRDVLVLEEHRCSGKPVQCAGLISPEVYEMSGVRPQIINRIRGARIIFPNGREIFGRAENDKAFVIDRSELDSLMAEKAADAGAEIRYGDRYVSHSVTDGTAEVRTSSGTVKTKMIIGANGCSESLIPNNAPKECIRGIGAEIKHRCEEQDVVTICIGSDVAPGFFAWEIPMGDVTRVGTASVWAAGPPIEYLNNMLRKRNLDGCEVIGRYCGKIPIGKRRTTYSDSLILVGDAASQVKPVSGGGLYPGFKSSDCAAKTVSEAFDKGDFSSGFLSRYEKEWKRAIGKGLSRAGKLRAKYVKLTDDEFNYIQAAVDNEKFIGDLTKVTIDEPTAAVSEVMRHPSVFLKAVPLAAKVAFR